MNGWEIDNQNSVLVNLAELLNDRNHIAVEISGIIGTPVQIGHVGEYIASQVFSITLEESASTPAIDGFFQKAALEDSPSTSNGMQKGKTFLTLQFNRHL